MTTRRGDRSTDRVEVIDSDPAAFGRSARSTTTPTTARRPPVLPVAAAVVVVVVVAAMVWRTRSPDEQAILPTTPVPTTVTVAATVPGGRPAPDAMSGLDFELAVEPSAAASRWVVSMQLTGDLSAVADRVAAVAWLDVQAEAGWRAVYWMARSSATSQEVHEVSDDHPEPGPDAVMVDADAPVEFIIDGIAAGSYRMCRYVPLRPGDAASVPASPAYVCAPVTVIAN